MFGHYQICRLLGQGGMGAVFEANDLESGRRVALKVLSHRLDSPEARARFFREGRLAASINHPNSVYVFGTEDIAGIPVIAMELVSGGTLQERVLREGPLSAGEAVDSVLQIVAGLESAQRAGILHRDIKPSNCFVDTSGTVKIGDFGLSISTLIRTEPAVTTTGAFLGTPAFSSPEQLRGDELTVRSDIYSVGVTLYYLLTCHHPFEAPDLVRMLATVLERRPEAPAKWNPGLPPELCRAVLRCLEKDPEKRFRSYDELRNALMPFASAAPAAARLDMRFLAYLMDALLMMLPSTLINMFVFGGLENFSNQMTAQAGKLPVTGFIQAALWIAYFGLFEGCFGATPGKFMLRLRVARLDRTVPGLPRAFLRALVFFGGPQSVWLLAWWGGYVAVSNPSLNTWLAVSSLLSMATMGLVFTTARRRNGLAGWHDLASGTRVVVKAAYQPRPEMPLKDDALPKPEDLPLVGPYHVLGKLGNEEGRELLLGFDARLLRRVWIRWLPSGAPPIAPNLRRISRPGRLRWLTGGQVGPEAWDAYEAVPGQTFLALLSERQPWTKVRYWLLDLAEELQAAAQDGSLPRCLNLDRIWITAEGRAKLLDFPAPGTASIVPNSPTGSEGPTVTPITFLRQVATSALEGRQAGPEDPDLGFARLPLAIHATQFLGELRVASGLDGILPRLRSNLNAPARLSRVRRITLLAGVIAFPALAMLLGGSLHAFTHAFLRAQPELATLWACLSHHLELETKRQAGKLESIDDLEALETYIAGRFAPLITNAVYWNRFRTRMVITDSLRADAERILAHVPSPTVEQMADSSNRVEAFFHQSPDAAARETLQRITFPAIALVVGYGNAVVFVIVPCLLGSLLFRGGLLVKLLGIVFVNPIGAIASRWRVTARALVAWLPFLLLPWMVMWLTPAIGSGAATATLTSLCAGLALLSALLPQRGLADRLTGTWPVPR